MLIVDMPMPRNCKECPAKEWGGACAITKQFEPCEGRPLWCPIKGVLSDEHGDLIDRDELLKECYPDDEFDAHVIYADDIQKAKAVIAAERKKSV